MPEEETEAEPKHPYVTRANGKVHFFSSIAITVASVIQVWVLKLSMSSRYNILIEKYQGTTDKLFHVNLNFRVLSITV